MDSSANSEVKFNIIIFNPQGESFVIQNATQVKAEEFLAYFKNVGNILTYKASDSTYSSWYRFSLSLKWEILGAYKVPDLYKAEAAIVL